MSIKGMTDQVAMFPTIGTLRKGDKKVSENKPGTDLTYLRFVSEDPLAQRMFNEAYPDEESLRNIHVFLPNKTADENMESWIEEWVAGGLVHRCDGETKVLWRTPQGGYSTERVPCQNCKGKQVGRLSVIVPELGRLACITILTTSIHDIIKLTQQLRAYEALRGDLRGIPLIVRRRKEKVSTPGPDGKRVRREKWLLSIETQPEWTMLQLSAMQRAALPAGEIVDDTEEGHYQEIGHGITNPFEEVDTDTGEVIQTSAPEQPTNGKPKTEESRPFPPSIVRLKLNAQILKGNYKDDETGDFLPISLHRLGDKTAGIVSKLLESAFPGDKRHRPDTPEAMRHAVTHWLFGVTSAKDLTAAQANALLVWLTGREAPGFDTPLNSFIPTEARAIYDLAIQEARANEVADEIMGDTPWDELETEAASELEKPF